MSTTKKLNVVIAGGSLGGLLYGLLLKRHGHTITILEQKLTTSMTDLGAGLSCQDDMLSYMSQYDFVKKPYFIESFGMRFIDTNNEIDPSNTGGGYRQKARIGSGYCDVPGEKEGDGIAAYWDGCVIDDVKVEDGKDGVSVVYRDQNGESRTKDWDLLIATDGSSSRVRKIFQPDVERTYSGYIGWRGTVPEDQISQATKEKLGPTVVVCRIDNSCALS